MVQMRQERITVLFGSPIVFSALADQPADSQALKSLRVCISTGARLTASVTTAILEKFGVRVQQLYGSSEAGTIAIQCRQAPDSSIGRPLKNVDVKILDIDGTHVGPMESGEIAIKSPAMTRGYVCESALNDETYHQGYLRTGDVGKIDRQGNLYVTGRIKRLINMSGVKVDPVEIEDVLKTHQKVKDAFVFGVNNHREIQVIKALIVADAECRCNEIVKHCRENLAEFKIPRIVEFVQQIPTDIMGKRNPDPKPFGV